MDMKDEDAEPATKGLLKAEIKGLRRDLVIELVKTNARLDELREDVSTKIKESTSRILKVVEDFAIGFQKVDRHQIITDYRVDELEKRVKSLESPA